ncbi:nucleotidyltransferase domain-containing protein [Phytohabitans sp. LJ34]|uniref:nucleotidyltransferase domain-containing protein n=1 Tax=Phytohabitans sp. LJ34 TaxID=3452217 RepID=UPI003F8A1E0C
MTPDIDAWAGWHPRVLAARMDGFAAPWYVAGGWAVDLFLGEQTRPHEDLEIAVPAGDFTAVAERFPECGFAVPRDGAVWPLSDEELRRGHQTWAWERAAGVWRFDVFREERDGDGWVCRRDARIRLPYAEVIRHDPDGIPYLAPEIVLLFKAKGARDKDVADLERVLPRLGGERRRWLADTLALVHPGHPWAGLAGG